MSKVKVAAKTAVILMMILTLMFSMTGCKKKNKLTTYRGKLNETLQEMNTVLGDMQTSVDTLNQAIENGDQSSYDTAIATLQTTTQILINGYHALANQNAPEDYQEHQKLLKQYADDIELMLSNEVRLYTLAGEAIGGYLTDDSAEQIGRLRTEIEALAASAAAFDNVLNEILGVSAPTSNESGEPAENTEGEAASQEASEEVAESSQEAESSAEESQEAESSAEESAEESTDESTDEESSEDN